LVFLVIHYLTRVWPWFVVGLAALVLIPLGQESDSLGGAAAWATGDREMAWPVLMAHLLKPGWLGLVLVSLLAAFMSTVDTHINWGASYIVTDIWLVLRPTASDREQIRVARTTVLLFVAVAIGVSFQISTIEQAWKWIAMLGASLGLPTLLRWLWWRVNATGELAAMLSGMLAGTLLALRTDLPYEIRLLWIAAASASGLVVGMFAGPQTDPECLHRFVAQVRPLGRWPQSQTVTHGRVLATLLRWAAVVAGTMLLLIAGHQVLFTGQWMWAFGAGVAALGCLWGGIAGAVDTT
jgi:Na+/proline symporter